MNTVLKVFFNTKTFEVLLSQGSIEVTTNPVEAELAVLGEKRIEYPAFENLKAVYRFGVGSDNIDFEYCKAQGIKVYFPSDNAKKVLFDATADFTAYAILTMLHEGAFGNVNTWTKKQRDHIGVKTVLVVGLGNIGGRVVTRLKPFLPVLTYDVLYNNPSELETMVRASDVISVHVPLIEETKNFFNEEKLSWVKDDAIIVNTARGALFDEGALYEKLSNSNCRAFFDVFWKEPYEGKLKGLGPEKFFMTPHSASNTKEFIKEGFKDIQKIIKEFDASYVR